MSKNDSKKGVRSSKIMPLADRVLVKELKGDEAEKITASGIIIPPTVNEDKGAKQGKVVAVGEGRYEEGKLIPVKIKVGDTVLFQWGDMIKVDGEEYHILREDNVLAVIKN